MALASHKIELTPRIGRLEREVLHGHTGLMVLFTGLSGAGKSTLANLVEVGLHRAGISTHLLDGDVFRKGLSADLGFSPQSRRENLRRLGEVGRLLVEGGLVTLAAFIAPQEADRRLIRELVGEESFMEVFVDCPLAVCEDRDPKGLYRRARAGELVQFTGVSSPYEPPARPDLVVRSHGEPPASSAARVVDHLRGHLRRQRARLS
jgi:adenylylsulfate kinase